MRLLPIGLALSGGTAKSVLHIGVIKALHEARIPVNYIAGTSGGSIVAAVFASGASITQMEMIAASMSWWKLASLKLSKLGFVSSEPIEKFIEGILPHATFEDLAIPCAVTTTNLVTGECRRFTNGPVAPVVRASCSIPQIYSPVRINEQFLVDGGLSEYLPAPSVRSFGAQFTIGVNLMNKAEGYHRTHNMLQLIMQITNMVARQNISYCLSKTDFLIHPRLDQYSAIDFSTAEELMEIGYVMTRRNIEDIKKIWRRKSRWLSRIRDRIAGAPELAVAR